MQHTDSAPLAPHNSSLSSGDNGSTMSRPVSVHRCARVDEDDTSPHSEKGWWFAEDASSMSSVDDSSSSALSASQPAPADVKDVKDVARAAAAAAQHGESTDQGQVLDAPDRMQEDASGLPPAISAPRCIRCQVWNRNQVHRPPPPTNTLEQSTHREALCLRFIPRVLRQCSSSMILRAL
jgi:hypothetical protein